MVEWKPIQTEFKVLRGKRLTKTMLDENAEYPVFHGGLEPLGNYNNYNREANTVMVINVGASAGTIGFCDKKFWSSDGCFCISQSENISSKYLYYYLQTKTHYLRSQVRYAGIPTLDNSVIEKLLFPFIPKPEQERIVKILDTFTDSIANLKAQIDARRKQYEYYRDQLLDLEGKEGVEMKTLGNIAIIKTGSKPKEILSTGIYKYINAGTTESGFINEINCDFDVVTTPSRGQGGIGFVGYQNKSFWLGPLCYQIRSLNTDILINKYLYYYLSSHNDEILQYKSEGGTPAVNAQDLKKIGVNIPPLTEQSRIVGILDQFEAIIANLEVQLKEREKQYEYYRNKLLTF